MSATDLNEVNKVILVVEDDDMVRRLLTKILQLSGYEVLEAADGAQALELSRTCQRQVHLMISDLEMPGMNGREVAEAMAKRRPHMSVLFISGHTDDSHTRKMLGEDVDFLSKPFLPKMLINKIREILDRQRQLARNRTNTGGMSTLLAGARSVETKSVAGNSNTAAETYIMAPNIDGQIQIEKEILI